MAKIAIEARKDKRAADGMVPLRLRISHKGVRCFVPLSLRLRPSQWNDRTCTVRKNHPQHSKLNGYLAGVLQTTQEAVQEVQLSGVALTADRIKQALQSKEEDHQEAQDFLDYCREAILDYQQQNRFSTFKAYRSAVHKLSDYVKAKHRRKTLPFDHIDVPLIRGFHTYLVRLGNKPNTVHKSITSIRTLLYRAIQDGLFPQEKNPFFQITLRREKVRKEKLSYEEIQAIEALGVEEGSLRWHVRNYWLFAFYAGGMRFSDVATLRWEHIRGDRIYYKMKKTRQDHGVPLLPQARAILDRYEQGEPASYVFPILAQYEGLTPEKLFNAIGSQNALGNKYLKELGKMAGSAVPLTFHLARHSIADHARRMGLSIYDISKLLGHANIQVTEQYLRGFDQEALDEKMKGLF